MPFLLQHFEQHLPGELVDMGRNLFEKNAVGLAAEADKHLWTGIVKDNEEYEVETQLSPSRVKAYTCDCETFAKDKICRHIVALLFVLKKIQAEKALKKSNERRIVTAKRTYQKLSINAVLQYTNEDSLKAFIKNYARNNRPFALALKAHFAIDVPLENSTLKYEELIIATVKSAAIPKNRLSPTSKKRLNWLLTQLEMHWQKAMVDKNYREALSILSATFDHLLPLKQKDLENKKSIEFLDRLSVTFQWLKDLLNSDMGPKLRKELSQLLEHKLRTRSWLLSALQSGHLADTLPQLPSQIRQHFLENLQETFNHLNVHSHYGQRILLLALKNAPSTKWPDYIFDLVNSPALLINLLDQTVLPEDLVLQKQLATIGIRLFVDPDYHLKMKTYLLQVAVLEEDHTKMIELSQGLFLATGKIEFYQILRDQLPNDSNLIDRILLQVKTLPHSLIERKSIAQLYLIESRWPDLLQLLQAEADLDLLMSLHPEIPSHIRPQLEPIYEKALRQYLGSYLGIPAARKVEKLFRHLSEMRANRLSQRLLTVIQKEFKEWKAVQQMLSGLRF